MAEEKQLEMLESAKQHFDNENYVAAHKILGKVTKSKMNALTPRQRAEAYSLLGVCFIETLGNTFTNDEGHFEMAEDYFKTAVRNDPSYASAHAQLAGLYIDRGIEIYANAVKQDPSFEGELERIVEEAKLSLDKLKNTGEQ